MIGESWKIEYSSIHEIYALSKLYVVTFVLSVLIVEWTEKINKVGIHFPTLSEIVITASRMKKSVPVKSRSP